MVKIAVSSQTPHGLDAITDTRFGRCPFYNIVEVDGRKIKHIQSVENPAINAFGGAGIQAAQFIANQGVKIIIAGNYGPNAFNALNNLGIQIYTGPAGVTVREAVEQYISGKLAQISAATGPAHMGMGTGGGRGMGRGMGRGRGMGKGTGGGAPQSPVVGGANFCPYCGAQTAPDARFCAQCGKSLE